MQRPQADRSYLDGCKAGISDVIECSSSGCEAGEKLNPACTNFPAFGAEAWDAGPARASRFAWDYELAFAGSYLVNWKNAVKANAFGLAHWYMAEAPGEVGPFLGDARTARSFGSSLTDASRIPKLLFYIYKVAWIPFSQQPGVVLAHHWNRSGAVRVNAFSNCPKVRLSLNGTSLGEKVPNPASGTGDDRTQTSTQLPCECWWDNVTWASGTLLAEGLDSTGKVVCSDKRVTAGNPDHIELTVEPRLTKPDGSVFNITANGTDCATILARVVDAAGNWCPTASNPITFSVTGPCLYRGGTDAFVTAGQPVGYHSPLDPELSAEGGMCKVAVRSTFTPGSVTVTAKSAGLKDGTASYSIVAVSAGPSSIAIPGGAREQRSAALHGFDMSGTTMKYYLSKLSAVSFVVLSASGRVVYKQAPTARGAGWTVSRIPGTAEMGAGVYIARINVDGKENASKRFFIVR
jgi:hypothetical protein